MERNFEAYAEAIPEELSARVVTIALINSLAEGFGNETSDVDLLVVVSQEGSELIERWTQTFLNGHRFDIYVLTEPLFLEKLRTPISINLGRGEVDFLHKVRTARPLRHHDRWLQFASTVDWGALDRALVQAFLSEAHLFAEDVAGNLAEGDVTTASLTVRMLVTAGFDAALAAAGQSQPRPKWRLKKARRAFGTDCPVLNEFLWVELGARPPLDKLGSEWLPRCFKFFRTLEMLAFFPATQKYRADILNSIGVYEHPLCSVSSALGSDYVLHDKRPIARVSADTALLWHLAPFASDLRQLRDSHASCSEKPMSEEWIAANIENLVDKRLLLHRATH